MPLLFPSNRPANQVISLLKESNPKQARPLALRLRDHTTGKSGLGLLFFILGFENRLHKLVISRFPADQGILAETKGRTLEVEFIERIFMKRATTYKAALYSGSSFDDHFWDGAAVDKQIGERPDQLANYWIHGFLASDFKTTPQAGSRRLALAFREALNGALDAEIKQEIISAATLTPRQKGRSISVRDIMARFQLSVDAQKCIIERLPNKNVADERFILDAEEFRKHLSFRSVELDTGVSMIGPTEHFDDYVKREPLGRETGFKFTTSGTIVAEKLKRGRG